jgi:hypothetical protein
LTMRSVFAFTRSRLQRNRFAVATE